MEKQIHLPCAYTIWDDELTYNRALRTYNSVNSYTLCVHSRDIEESELQKFYSRLIKVLKAKEHGHETIDSLQRLHLILSANKYSRQ